MTKAALNGWIDICTELQSSTTGSIVARRALHCKYDHCTIEQSTEQSVKDGATQRRTQRDLAVLFISQIPLNYDEAFQEEPLVGFIGLVLTNLSQETTN